MKEYTQEELTNLVVAEFGGNDTLELRIEYQNINNSTGEWRIALVVFYEEEYIGKFIGIEAMDILNALHEESYTNQDR